MIAKTQYDRGISTIQTSAFNYDGEKHDTISIEEGRDIFDYKINIKPCYTASGDVVPGINYLENVRGGSSNIIPSYGVGEGFKVIDSLQWYDQFTQQIMPEIPDLHLESCFTMYGGGASVFIVNSAGEYSVKGDESPNRTRFLFSNQNTGKGSLTIGLTEVRIVCMNTLALAVRNIRNDGNGMFIRHTKNSDCYVKCAISTIEERLRQSAIMRQRIDALARVNVSVSDLTKVLNRIYPIKGEKGSYAFTRTENIRNEVIHQFESGETAQSFTEKNGWCLFNALSFRAYNPLTDRKTTDKAEIAFRGSIGDIGLKVANWFNIVEQELGTMAA